MEKERKEYCLQRKTSFGVLEKEFKMTIQEESARIKNKFTGYQIQMNDPTRTTDALADIKEGHRTEYVETS